MARSDSKNRQSLTGDIDWLERVPVIGPILYQSLVGWQRTFAPIYYEPAYVRHTGRAASPHRKPRAHATGR